MKATLFVIENDADHAQAKALIEKLMGSNVPADRARLTAQARLVEAGPAWPFTCRSGTALGTPSRVSEVLTGKRELSMSMVRKLRDRFHISADLLISLLRRRGLMA
jgi:HTH-type transcriptional regulator/antitoxin HigA